MLPSLHQPIFDEAEVLIANTVGKGAGRAGTDEKPAVMLNPQAFSWDIIAKSSARSFLGEVRTIVKWPINTILIIFCE